jgi:hypothetical protein
MGSLRRRSIALLGLALYGAAALALPAAHLLHHKLDHRHGPDGSLLVEERDAAVEHQAFDADLAALDLSDAAHLGIASVDCAFAQYTLAACDDPAAPPHTFGDELIARTPHRHSAADAGHGAGSLAHFGLALVVAQPILLPPPAHPSTTAPPLSVDEQPASTIPLALRARGPPSCAI